MVTTKALWLKAILFFGCLILLWGFSELVVGVLKWYPHTHTCLRLRISAHFAESISSQSKKQMNFTSIAYVKNILNTLKFYNFHTYEQNKNMCRINFRFPLRIFDSHTKDLQRKTNLHIYVAHEAVKM